MNTPQGTQTFSQTGAERLYRVLAETMLEAALAVSPDGTILFCNQRFCDLMHVAMPGTVGRRGDAFIDIEQREDFAAFLRAARTGPVRGQFVMLASDGTAVPAQLAANPLDDGDNLNVCVVASDLPQLAESTRSIDLLQEHRRARESAQAALRESEQRLSFAQTAAGAGIWDWDVSTGEIIWTEELFRLFGLDPAKDQAGFDSWRCALHPDDRAEAEERIATAIASHSRLSSEYRVVLPSGDERWISSLGDTTYDANGTPLRMSGICIDITARKRTEELARQRLSEIEDLYRNAPVGLCVLDRELHFLRINERLAEINGVPAADHIGRSVRDVLPDLAGVVEPEMRRVLETGQPRLDIEIKGETPAQPGVERSWLEQWLPIMDGQSHVTGLSIVVEETTERKRTEAALRASEERLRLVIETSPIAIGFGDSAGTIFEANGAFYRLTGYTREELRASRLGWNHLTAPEYAELDREIMATLAATGSAGPYEKEYVRKDGSRVPLLLSVSKLPGRDEHVAFIVDITERIAAEAALRQSRENLIRAQEVGQIGWWRLDMRRNVLTWSEQNHRIFGVPTGTPLSYETFQQCVHPEDRAFVDARWKAGVAGEPYDIEHRIVVDGRTEWVREKAYLEFDRDRTPISGFGITQCITERKLAEEVLRHAEEERKIAAAVRIERGRLYNVLDTLPAMICLLTPDYQVAFANRSFREQFGESEGRRCFEYCFGRPSPCEFCRTYNVLKTGEPQHWEVTTPNGTVIDVHDLPFTDIDGSPMILEMDLDITERRRIENELQRAHEDLAERAAQLRALAGELTLSEQRERRRLAKVLHDHLQQLLVGAKFRTAIVARMGDELIRQAAAEIEHLLDESITASRSLTAELSPPILHEAGLAAAVAWLARWMADRHGLRVSLSVEEGLPDLPEDVRVLLFESVRELLFNAVKHAHVAAAYVAIRRTASARIQITVSDAGPGFDPSALKKAGETGGGFGLFGIRERLELVGGRLAIDSAPGKGSRITLMAPLGKLVAAAPPAVTAAPRAARTRPEAKAHAPVAGSQISVLIADDHAVVREGLRRLLDQERDIRIVGEAADGREAVEMTGELQPDVVLMDVSMPTLDGVDATRAIHRDYPEVRIIGLSMFEDEEHAHAMRDAGAVDYLTKGGPPRDLIHAIRHACHPSAHGSRSRKPAGRARRKDR
jgi:PAS domain S-box-containing protein